MLRLFCACLAVLSFVRINSYADPVSEMELHDPLGPTIVTEAEEEQKSTKEIAEQIIKKSTEQKS